MQHLPDREVWAFGSRGVTSEPFRALIATHKVIVKQPTAAPSTSPTRSRPG
jgi:hypothetical protein